MAGKIEAFDLSDVESGFEAKPVGRYHAKFIAFEIGEVQSEESENRGKPQVSLRFAVNGAKHPNFKGQLIFDRIGWWGPYTKKDGTESRGMMGRWRELCEALGVPPEEMKKFVPMHLAKYKGREVEIRIGHEEYEGKTRERVKQYVGPAGALAPSPVRASDPFA